MQLYFVTLTKFYLFSCALNIADAFWQLIMVVVIKQSYQLQCFITKLNTL